MDIFTREKRSQLMANVKSKNTKPEIIVRKILFSMGYRYRIHYSRLPGNPDIVLPKYHSVIFINGCFWHQHHGCKKATIPKSNHQFWLNKLEDNVNRDQRNVEQLEQQGWKVIVLWECDIENDIEGVTHTLISKF